MRIQISSLRAIVVQVAYDQAYAGTNNDTDTTKLYLGELIAPDPVEHVKNTSSAREDQALSASMASVNADEQHAVAIGKLNPLYNDKDVSPSAAFNLASLSKFILMTMCLRLQQQGKICLTERISNYINEPVLDKDLTIAHLLAHRSGMLDKGFVYVASNDPLEKILSNKRACQPGAAFHYANINYVVIAKLIEAVMQTNLQQAFMQLIGVPLQLNNTQTIDSKTANPVAAGYRNNHNNTSLINVSNFQIYGATSFRGTAQDAATIIYHFFKDDNFIKPSSRKLALDSISKERFVTQTENKRVETDILVGIGLEKHEVMIGQDQKITLYGHSGWQGSHAAFFAYCPEAETAYCCCVSKTQGLHLVKKQARAFLNNNTASVQTTNKTATFSKNHRP